MRLFFLLEEAGWKLKEVNMESLSFVGWVVGIILVLVDLWALASIWQTTKPGGIKLLWTVGIMLFPILGLVVWGIFGPRGIAQPPSSPNHSKG